MEFSFRPAGAKGSRFGCDGGRKNVILRGGDLTLFAQRRSLSEPKPTSFGLFIMVDGVHAMGIPTLLDAYN